MNGEPFLTKPPLMYWLPATVFAVVGPTEYARFWSVLGRARDSRRYRCARPELFARLQVRRRDRPCDNWLDSSLKHACLPHGYAARTDGDAYHSYWYLRLRRGAGIATVAAFGLRLGLYS